MEILIMFDNCFTLLMYIGRHCNAHPRHFFEIYEKFFKNRKYFFVLKCY